MNLKLFLNNLQVNWKETEYIYFDAATNTCPPALNSDKTDWRITSIQDCISEYLGGLEKGDSDNDNYDFLLVPRYCPLNTVP